MCVRYLCDARYCCLPDWELQSGLASPTVTRRSITGSRPTTCCTDTDSRPGSTTPSSLSAPTSTSWSTQSRAGSTPGFSSPTPCSCSTSSGACLASSALCARSVYVLYSVCTVQCMYCTVYVLYSVCTVQCMYCTVYVLYSVCTVQCIFTYTHIYSAYTGY